MIEDTLRKIEDRVKASQSLGDDNREGLLELVAQLKSEIGSLGDEDADGATSIATFADASTHEATRSQRDPKLVAHSVDGLAQSVAGFETRHPALVGVVNRLCKALSDLGI